jgi:hypothetical protein
MLRLPALASKATIGSLLVGNPQATGELNTRAHEGNSLAGITHNLKQMTSTTNCTISWHHHIKIFIKRRNDRAKEGSQG